MSDTHPGVWYFAHPFTTRNTAGVRNQDAEIGMSLAADERSARLMACGYTIFSPICHSFAIAEAGLIGAMATWGTYADAFGDRWYAVDRAILELGGDNWAGIILAPGWEDSAGCSVEKEWFEKRGLPVRYYEEIMAEPQEEDAA